MPFTESGDDREEKDTPALEGSFRIQESRLGDVKCEMPEKYTAMGVQTPGNALNSVPMSHRHGSNQLLTQRR